MIVRSHAFMRLKHTHGAESNIQKVKSYMRFTFERGLWKYKDTHNNTHCLIFCAVKHEGAVHTRKYFRSTNVRVCASDKPVLLLKRHTYVSATWKPSFSITKLMKEYKHSFGDIIKAQCNLISTIQPAINGKNLTLN